MPLPERRVHALLWMMVLTALTLAVVGQLELAFLAFAGVLLLAFYSKSEKTTSSSPEAVWTGD